jgi:hypothetical protein
VKAFSSHQPPLAPATRDSIPTSDVGAEGGPAKSDSDGQVDRCVKNLSAMRALCFLSGRMQVTWPLCLRGKVLISCCREDLGIS